MIPTTKHTEAAVQLSLAQWFQYWRQLAVVPNTYMGYWSHEIDLLVVTKAGYAYEVEIKTTKADLKADQKKRHGHNHRAIRKLWFAIPFELYEQGDAVVGLVPERAGILTYHKPEGERYYWITQQRAAKIQVGVKPLHRGLLDKVLHGAMCRMWSGKTAIQNLLNERGQK